MTLGYITHKFYARAKEYNELSEYEKRLYRRNQARKGNYNLNQTAIKSGVKDLARFHNSGYKGLYNGETADDICSSRCKCQQSEIKIFDLF